MTRAGVTPLMRQYYEIKNKYPGTILLFRVGDFYETFADDAITVSKELGITLTKRNNGGDQTPLAGFPHHALDTYLPKLVRKGHRVAVCDQTQDPEEAKLQRKIVEREVTEIVTPGTALSDRLLDHQHNNYLLAAFNLGEIWGTAYADISTAEFYVHETDLKGHLQLVNSLQPAEILLPHRWKKQLQDPYHAFTITWMDDWIYEGDFTYQRLTDHFQTHSLKGYGVESMKTALVAAGALLHYVNEAQKNTLSHLRKIKPLDWSDTMLLDSSTKRNLELTATLQEGSGDGSLIAMLDLTCTPMGARLLRRRVQQPLRHPESIQQRLDAVDHLHASKEKRAHVRDPLQHIGDLERLMSRIALGRCSARELRRLGEALAYVAPLKASLLDIQDPLLQQIEVRLEPLDELRQALEAAIVDDPPAGIRDGGFIRTGYSEALDFWRNLANNSKTIVAGIHQDLIRATGINSLKLGYNKVFGYYIEVTKTHQEKIPDYFIRKQTLVNAERYITPELKEVEEKILNAEAEMNTLEESLFESLRLYVAGFTEQVQELAQAIAELDVYQCLAEVAHRNHYVKPVINDLDEIHIVGGRHPVVEKSLPLGEPFIPNDIRVDNQEQQILIITGPNMAGKSLILRQTGLIVLLAQMGSFVPATSAAIGVVDKIFTRVGASDNLAAGESTFLVEMNEAANILNNATSKSLLLWDEVGRGTSTFDGLSIAWSLVEFLHNHPSVAAKTLFATHYHELNELANRYPRIRNYNVQVQEYGGKIVFLRKLIPGGADHSYGIQVAAMAGLPEAVLIRAREILNSLESHSLTVTYGDTVMDPPITVPAKDSAKQWARTLPTQDSIPQLTLFQPESDPTVQAVIDKLKASEVDRMTPLEALMLLSELRRSLS